jgi:hypothetical protein
MTAYNYESISEMARSLGRTLQAAPAQESRRAAALRQYLITVTQTLAEAADRWVCETDSLPSKHHLSCRLLVEQVRRMAAELTAAPPIVPPGIGVVVEAFSQMLLPDTLLVLRPSRRNEHSATEHLERLTTRLEETGLACEQEGEVPRYFLTLYYPQGEQDNVLLACIFLRAFGRILLVNGQRLNADEFASGILGPAYLFARAADFASARAFDTYGALHLYWAIHTLQQVGWFDHPHIGPLLRKCLEENDPDRYLTEETHAKFEAAKSALPWQERFPMGHLYTPADFDRDVPRLWERLRQLIPPNDLDIEAVESAQPANEVSILNAGWSFYLLHIDDMYRILGSQSAEDRYEARQVLNRLLTKGIELAQIARRWQAAKEEAGA